MRFPTRTTAALVALVLSGPGLLTACGSSDRSGGSSDSTATSDAGRAEPPGPAKTSFTLVEKEFSYAPKAVKAKADADLHFSFDNQGSVEHDFVVDEIKYRVITKAGEKGSGPAFKLKAGTYTFYCSIPGHRVAGMEGTLYVTK